MKNYYRIMAGPKSVYAEKCFKEGFIGVDFNLPKDFTGLFHENWRNFNKEYISLYLNCIKQNSH